MTRFGNVSRTDNGPWYDQTEEAVQEGIEDVEKAIKQKIEDELLSTQIEDLSVKDG